MDPRLIILKLGTTFPDLVADRGDYEDWFIARLGLPRGAARVVDPRSGDSFPALDETDGTVVTGAHEMVTDREPWSEESASWLRAVVHADRPVLAVCYGHQLLAQALGGEVRYHPGGREVGTVSVRCLPGAREDVLFGGFDDSFVAHVAHAQTVSRLPDGAVPLASGDFEETQAFRVGRCAWGVQFHPEFPEWVIREYIVRQRHTLEEEGQDVNALLRGIRPSGAGALIERFGRVVASQSLSRRTHPSIRRPTPFR